MPTHRDRVMWRQLNMFPVHRKDRLDRLKAYERSKARALE